jgi:hypothetical protein
MSRWRVVDSAKWHTLREPGVLADLSPCGLPVAVDVPPFGLEATLLLMRRNRLHHLAVDAVLIDRGIELDPLCFADFAVAYGNTPTDRLVELLSKVPAACRYVLDIPRRSVWLQPGRLDAQEEFAADLERACDLARSALAAHIAREAIEDVRQNCDCDESASSLSLPRLDSGGG